MSLAAESMPALYPPTVSPPKNVLPLHKFVVRFIKNPLLALPQAAYEEPVVSLENRRRDACWVLAPDLVEEVLIKRTGIFVKSPIEKRVFRRSLKDGVLSADGSLWRWQRRTMAPLFRPGEVLSYVPSMAQPAEELLAKWRTAGPSSTQRIDEDMTEATFSVIARTMLKGGNLQEADTIKQATHVSLKHISWEIMYGILNLPLWMPHPASRVLKRSSQRLRNAVHDIILRRQQEAEFGEDLLARLLAARDPETDEPMDMERLINNLLTLLEAGHETTAKALTWTLYLLARAQDWQDRLRAEVTMVCGEGPIAADHVAKLKQTQQVLKEAMRLYPPVPMMSRLVTQDTELGGVTLRQGALTVIPIYCIHRHKALWTDPSLFDPMRFTPEREADMPRTQFMPFGAGPRICLGNSFAMTEATVILASLIRAARFDWDGKTLPEPVSRVTLQPRGGMPLKVTMLGQKPLEYV